MSDAAGKVPEQLERWLRDYYREAIETLALNYPSEQSSLRVEYADLYQFDADLADAWLADPSRYRQHAATALGRIELPADVDLSGATVRLCDGEGALPRVAVTELGSEHIGQYAAVEGVLARVTDVQPRAEEIAWECERCGTMTCMPQRRGSTQEPHECQGCERQGPWTIVEADTEWVDQRKVKLEQPIGDRGSTQPADVPAYVEGDLVHAGGENGLPDRSGERVTLLGEVCIDKSSIQGRNADPEARLWLDVHAIEWEEASITDVDVEAHRDDVEELAARDDAIDLIRESILPSLHRSTEAMDTAFTAAVAWLFAAPRYDPEGADRKRGDIHMALIGDPGTGKSSLGHALHRVAPDSELRSGTGMTDAGLTAAATQEEFHGSTEWTLNPGILPRANGGHAIIDEVDKADGGDVESIHDALEGEQVVSVDKAGISADLPTRAGTLMIGNPTEGRWDEHQTIAEQIDLDPALLDRMDVILTLRDQVDEDSDRATADHILEAWDEVSRLDAADDTADVEQAVTDRPVDLETLRAWVVIGREEVRPSLTDAAREELRDQYVSDRGLNDRDDDAPVPATPRSLEAGIRLALAFARAELSETVDERHAELATDVSRSVVGEHWDPESGRFDASKRDSAATQTQADRRRAVLSVVDDVVARHSGDPAPREEVVETASEDLDLDSAVVEDTIQTLRDQGKVYAPSQGEVRRT